ncbi:hypothetical protein ASC94_11860 [Massilia sp. Root418]|uniref:YDG domain-containing protein n=1 Tax=Massilia sp. Root418 TaxID=1736532 RepID=UPI0006FCB1BC|nr:YDG domain-containing protein [Massilia sp. Root418]KQW93334.1 hypothetical protein ASC94_11860 [Massilia sp. Root418]
MHKHATMNRYYRLVWSHVHACWVAVAEGARGHGKGGTRRRKAALLAALAAAGMAGPGSASAAPPLATALPTGGQVAAGQAQIATSGSQMTVTQATSQAILNWNSFDIGAQASVQFKQPSANAVALNRVQSANPSQIYGKLDANGQVFLVNPNGVLFAPGAQVNVGGLVASSLDLADRDFMARSYQFAGQDGGAVRNEGSIAAGPRGYVALLGPSVANSGSISAPQGSVALAAGQQIGVDLRGDGLITVRTSRGALNALAENQGLIQAAGGQVLLSASAADALARASVNNTGLVQAGSLVSKGGSIRLVAEGGDVQAGRLDASSADGQGGSVAISGNAVSLGGAIGADGKQGGSVSVTAAGALASGGSVSAQGTDGNGGSIAYRAGGSLTETAGATANASGTQGGGSIALQAGGSLLTSGSYSARGGEQNGGRIDLSGSTVSLLSAKADASGQQQGGLVRIGGAFQGGAAQDAKADARFAKNWGKTAAIASADLTFINDSSAIDVSARGAAGKGGTAIVWSERQTTMLGALDARGGTGNAGDGGRGGAVEVSSHGDLRYVGLDAIQAGQGGTLLLDPKNLVIGDFNYAYAWTAEAILGRNYAGGKNAGGGLLSSGASFGSAVALSADGTVLAVGVPMDAGVNNTGSAGSPNYVAGSGAARGAVRLFGFTDSNFSGATLRSNIGSGYTGSADTNLALADGALFGSAVALNAAGTKLAVGAVGENGGAGSVRQFDLAAGTSKATLTGTIDAGSGSTAGARQFGAAVALNGDGTKLAVGAVNDGGPSSVCTSCGAVYLYNNGALSTRLGDGYNYQVSTGANAQFGSAVALNAAGDKLAVGAVGLDDLKGAVYVFNWGSSVAQTGILSSGVASSGTNLNVNLSSGELFGSSLAFDSAGTTLAVGSPSTGGVADAGLGPGSVRLFSNIGGTPTVKAVLRRGLRMADGVFHTTPDYSGFGYAVALNGAGDRLIVGAPYANSADGSVEGTGAVYAYTLNSQVFRDVNYTDATGLNVGVDATGLAQMLANGTSVALRASNDLLVNGAVQVNTGSPRGSLTLEAGRSITVNASIVTGGGNVSLLANANNYAVSMSDRETGNAGLTVASGVLIDSGAGTASLLIDTGHYSGQDASGDIQVDGTVRGSQISLINNGKTAGSDVRLASTGRLVGTGTSGTSVLVAASGAGGGAFVSSAGGSTISTGANSRYLVYSDAPGTTTEGMSGYNKHYNQAYAASAPSYAGSGNWFLYKTAPTLTVTPTSGLAKVYDGQAMGSISYASVSGLIDGDANGALTGSLSGTTDKNAGSYSVQLGTLASSLGYIISLAPRTYSITPRSLTATATGSNKVYDGLTGATVIFGDNRIGGDLLTLSGNASFGSKGVGNGKAISVSGIALSGTDAANYTLANTTATASGNITPRTLHTAASDVTRVYNGLAGVTGVGGILTDDRVSGDVLTLSGNGNFEDKNAGSGKTVNYNGIAISGGADAGNYVLDSATATGLGTITQRALTATATGVGKVYDGLTGATVTLGDNRVSGDALTLTSAAANYADKNAGNGKAISVSGIALSGTDAANYALANTTATASANIAKRTLVARATGVDKVYDGLTTAVVTLGDDRLAGDVLTTSGTGAFSDKNAGTGKSVNVTGITLSGTDAANYALASTAVTATGTISQRVLHASAVGVDKVYDGLTGATATLADDRVAGDALTLSAGGAAFADKNAGNGKTVTVSGVTLAGNDAGNYTLASDSVTGTANITRRALAASATGIDKVYDGMTGASVTFGDNRVSGDVLSLSGSAAFGDKNAGSGKTVTVTGIALAGTDAANYTLAAATASTTAAITPRALVASATGIDKVYDGQATATVTLGDNRIANDVLTLSSSGATFADKNAGSGKAVSVTGIALGGADAANYTLSSATASTSAAITPRVLNASATATGKVYDGQTAASATLADDRVAGDELTLASTGAAFADKNAGTGKTVTVSGISVSGADAGNYTLASGSASATASITKRALTASTGTVDKVYDGLAAATIALGDDRVAGDALTTSGNAVYSDKNVGSGKTVSVTGIALSGADAGNYTLTSTSANTTGSIMARTLHATTTGGGKVYDGSTSATVTLGDDRIAGDALTLTGGSASFADKNAGSGKTVTVSGLVLSGNDAGNYVLASASATGSADITARTLTAGAVAANKVYDGNAVASVSYSDNRIAGDILSISGNAAFADKHAGTGKTVTVSGMALGGADAGNYVLASTGATGSANITARQLAVSATGGSKVYDGSAVATVTLGDNRISGDALTLSSAGAAFADKNAGSGKTVTVSGLALAGADAGNYTLAATSTSTSANIAQRALNATATGINKTYDGTTAATVTLADDRVSGDALTLAGSATFADKNAGTGKAVTVSGLALSGTDAANYTLAATTASTSADIAKRALNVAGGSVTKVYDGLVAGLATLSSDAVAGDALSISGNAVYADKNAGAGKAVNVSGIAVGGADAANYTLASTTLATTGAITRRELTATATGGSKVYDGTVAAAVTLSDNRVAGDSLALSGSGSYSDKNAGAGKTITVGAITLSGADAANYVMAPAGVQTTGSITARALSATATAQGKVYDGTVAASVSFGSDALSGDAVSLSGQAAFADKNAGSGKTVNVSGITLSGADAGNYVLGSSSASTTASIAQRAISVTASAASKVYDGTTAATVSLSDDRVAGDTLALSSGSAAFADKNAGSGKAVTVTGIALSGADAGNYTLASTTASGTGTITQRTLNASATAASKVYDGTTAATVTLGDDRIAGDALALGIGAASFADKNAGSGKAVGVSGIALSGADAGNYVLASTTAGTSGTITQRVLNASAAGVSKVYDGSTSATVVLSDDRIAGDALQVSGQGSFSDANAGSGKKVNISGLALSGADAGNYTFAGSTATGVGTITQRALQASISGNTVKTYDGTTAAVLNPGSVLLSGFVAGQGATLQGGAGRYNNANVVGATTVTADLSGANFSAAQGTLLSNYLLPTAATGAGAITPRTVTVTGVQAAAKVYDGTTAATLSSRGTLAGLVAGENLTLNGPSTGVFDTRSAGAGKTVTASGYTLADGAGPGAAAGRASNYALTSSTATGTGTISQATLSVLVDDKTRVQGTQNPVFTSTVSGLVGGDTRDVLGNLTLATSATAQSAAGQYAITASGGAAPNDYRVFYLDGVLTVTAAGVLPGQFDPVAAIIGSVGSVAGGASGGAQGFGGNAGGFGAASGSSNPQTLLAVARSENGDAGSASTPGSANNAGSGNSGAAPANGVTFVNGNSKIVSRNGGVRNLE